MTIQTTTSKPQIPSGIITTSTSGTSPGPIKALPDTPVRVPNSTANVLAWIKKAIDSGPSPYSYLSVARNRDHLDRYDDNLAAAERYFEGYDDNFNESLIVGSFLVKEMREVHVGDFKPFEKVFGRNGSQSPEFVTRWGMLGIFDRENGITPAQRVARGDK